MEQDERAPVTIGKVLKPRGLSGELKVQILTNRAEAFTNAKSVYLGGKKFSVAKASVQNGFAYLTLAGIDSADTAERLRGRFVCIERAGFALAPDEVLSTDLIGFQIADADGNILGTLTDIIDYGAGDVFECTAPAGGTFSFPNEDAFITETNMTERKIVVKKDMLSAEIVL
jgi:16S rRNA processing protein RimM